MPQRFNSYLLRAQNCAVVTLVKEGLAGSAVKEACTKFCGTKWEEQTNGDRDKKKSDNEEVIGICSYQSILVLFCSPLKMSFLLLLFLQLSNDDIKSDFTEENKSI